MNSKTSENDLLEVLVRILQQERRLGYSNRAVFGGIEKFLQQWLTKVSAARCDGLLQSAVDIIASLQSYASLDRSQREAVVETALAALAELKRSAINQAVDQPADRVNSSRNAFERSAGGARTSLGEGEWNDRLLGKTEYRKSNREQLAFSRSSASLSQRLTDGTSPGSAGDQRAAKGALTLDSSVKALPGVGPSYGAKLERLGVRSVRDLLYFFPRRHIDYSVMKRIKDLTIGETESLLGTIWEVKSSRARSGVLVISATVADETGTVQAIWFNQQHLTRVLTAGRQVVLSGKIEQSLGRPLLKSPDWELLEADDLTHTGRLVPVYPLTEGISQRWLRALVKRTVDRWANQLPEHLPGRVREWAKLMDLPSAIAQIHYPDSQRLLTRARQRLIFDELFLLQLGMLLRKRRWQESQAGHAFVVDRALLERFVCSLPFALTRAQCRALDEIISDLQRPKAMTRLLQGDVGAGKTVVATAAMVIAWANGFQSALMAPTEILAEQHYKTVSGLLAGLGRTDGGDMPNVKLLTGSVRKQEKEEICAGLARGEIDIVIGTHAVIQDDVIFKCLGLAIVDEQHRFGVLQRAQLKEKGYNPHVLVMTATPIPRTLALTLYGDLDISVIDELPPGRQEVKTYLLGSEHRQKAYEFLRKQVHSGRQAFIICPLVEESDRIEAKAAVAEYERLRRRVFPDLKLGLLHGKMRPQEKEAVMEDFRQGKIDVLVSTPVVEVGIDVPNATVMLIEGADRFGLAQLHQFRGRVGRGSERSYCLLLADSPSTEAEERLQVITQTQNGFALAEEDLRLRGPGEFFGTRQSGMPDLKIAGLSDVAALEQARNAALELFARDPGLQLPEHRLLAQQVAHFWQAEGDLI